MEGEEAIPHDFSVDGKIHDVEQRPVKMKVEAALALRWAKETLHIEPAEGGKPPRESDEWFRNYNPTFTKLLEEDIQTKGQENNFLALYEQALNTGDAEEMERILHQIEHSMYQPVELHN